MPTIRYGMRTHGAAILALAVILLCSPITPRAVADGRVGGDPSSNFTAGPLPSACDTAPTGTTCIAAAIADLDQARARLGQPPYALPANFASLTAPEQAFVLTNLDRISTGSRRCRD